MSVYAGVSLDGFLAAPDGDLSWLDEATRPDEDYGYDAFVADVDLFAMGRGTYDHIAHLEPLPFGGRRVEVFTHRAPAPRPGVAFVATDAETALRRWAAEGVRHAYVDGGRLVAQFLAVGGVDDLTLTVVPLLLGAGLPLFPPTGRTTWLALEAATSFPSGVAQLRYVRAPT